MCTGGEGSREINQKESIAFPSEARGAEKSFQIRLGEGVERVKFENVSPRVNTRCSEDLDHVRDAEVDRRRGGRFKGGSRPVSCRYLGGSGANSTTGGQRCEADDEFLTMAAELEATPIFVIDCYYSLKELVIKFEWNRLMCKSKGLAINY